MLDNLSWIETDIILGLLMIGCVVWFEIKQRGGGAAYVLGGITGLAATLYSVGSGITYNAILIWILTFALLLVGYTCSRLFSKE